MESGILVAALLGAMCLAVALYVYVVGLKASARRKAANLETFVELSQVMAFLEGSVEMLEEDNERKEAALSTIAKASSSKNGTARRLARIAKAALAD